MKLVYGPAQEVLHTASRRAQPRAWKLAVEWLISAGLHPKATRTTMRLAKDLAARMDYRRGIVLYDLAGTAERLGLSEATVKRHAAILRELGALVWLEHGSRRNLRLPGRAYTATATIYGAVIPAVYDTAMGIRVRGEGYEAALIGYTAAGRKLAVAARRAASRKRLAPPSRGSFCSRPADEVDGDGKATRTARASRSKSAKKSTLGRRITGALFQAADRLARRLRPLHAWTQRAKINELSWVLADKLAAGCTEEQVDAWLRDIAPAVLTGLDWRPDRPHTYIASQLLQEQRLQQDDVQRDADWSARSAPNTAAGAALQQVRLQEAGEEIQIPSTVVGLDPEALARFRTDAWASFKYAADPALVMTAYETLGPEMAVELYGQELVSLCLSLEANSNNRRIRLH
ncbi:cell wall protein [Streptomyces sp. NPDC001584]|uniref:cell wall protein n=1 Tax=Streptomyces sp. NPDC001584 TaxID=3154521 RepID=UPI00331C0669